MPTLLPVSDILAVGFNDGGQPMAAGRDAQPPDEREARRLAHAYREQLLQQVALLTQWLAATERPSEERRIVVANAMPQGLRP